MRRTALASALIAALVLGPGAFGATARSRAAPPSLRVLKMQPLEVRGENFKPAERVKVVLLGLDRRVRWVRSSAAGDFVAAFEGGAVDRCAGFTVVARGQLGSRAVLRHRAIPADCPGPSVVPD